MSRSFLSFSLAAAAVATSTAAGVFPGSAVARAAPTGCPDVEVVFARGTFEPAGLGQIGDEFVSSLRERLPQQTVWSYGVAYPASLDFGRAAEGVADASRRIQEMAARCPGTDIVLGGYSQGGAVSAYATSDTVPANFVLPVAIDGLMPPDVAKQVAAVTLFGKPSGGFLELVQRGAPPIVVGAPYAPKTLDLCAPADPICEPGSLNRDAHGSYVINGMTDQAAEFAARQLQTS
jgi:cutinase